MENKKSFLLYADLIHTVNKLPDEKAGLLLKHILSYVNDENPETDDILVQIAFEPIKQQLKRDLVRWRDTQDSRSLNGREGNLKRWNKDLYDKYKKEKITLEEAESIAKDRKVSPPDVSESPPIAKIAVNDIVTVNVNGNDIVTSNIYSSFEEFWDLYDYKKGKPKAEGAWAKLKPTEQDDIMKYLPAYKLSTPDKKYRQHPSTFLNKRTWEDEILQESNPHVLTGKPKLHN